MSERADNRTVLFLFPDYEEYETISQLVLTRLISDLKIIINTSNENIRRILQDGGFSYIRCLPSIEMEELNKNPEPESADLVRVCVISHDNEDYESHYKEICESYSKNEVEISHLIGLRINNIKEEVSFKESDSSFDVIVETNLNDLECVLISIMLDTSVYHYFSLDNNIRFRKNFSKLKVEGIKESDYAAEYGTNVNWEGITYLPFSYPYVKEYFDKSVHNPSEKHEAIISELIESYFDLILSHICKSIRYNKRKELLTPYDSGVNKKAQKALDKIIEFEIFEPNKEYIVLIKKTLDLNKNISINADDNIFVLEIQDTTITEWLSRFSEPLTDYLLFRIIIGD